MSDDVDEREKYSDPDPKDGLSTSGGADDPRRGKGSYYRNKFKRAKRMALFPFRKVKRLLSTTKKINSSSSDSHNRCYNLCFMPPPPTSLNSPIITIPHVTNEPARNQEFSYDFLKTLIEKNDFYCKECNVHTARG
ncbi:hypothetical protein H6P81_004548 [Aristolochia fimbriata]|uniref:Uncharacterized protein n=1 Tax=Aristolochia fimbriata TaxID=158543 RepID=A0AAV7FFP3_ARIFI|nr:hypothetical protein H6P81_004548 [Aristolochia fimbriata]